MHEFDKVNDLNEKDGRGYGHSVLENMMQKAMLPLIVVLRKR